MPIWAFQERITGNPTPEKAACGYRVVDGEVVFVINQRFLNFGFSYIGLIYLIMLFVPNIIWTKNKPEGYGQYAEKENKILLAFERAGEVLVCICALIFSDFNIRNTYWIWCLIASFVFMVLYEIYWLRYFKSEKTMRNFYSSLIGIAVAGASLPVIAFFLLVVY